jgi:hypothetical protein
MQEKIVSIFLKGASLQADNKETVGSRKLKVQVREDWWYKSALEQ